MVMQKRCRSCFKDLISVEWPSERLGWHCSLYQNQQSIRVPVNCIKPRLRMFSSCSIGRVLVFFLGGSIISLIQCRLGNSSWQWAWKKVKAIRNALKQRDLSSLKINEDWSEAALNQQESVEQQKWRIKPQNIDDAVNKTAFEQIKTGAVINIHQRL